MKNTPGPREGLRLSECVWTLKPDAAKRSYDGTLNALICSAWKKPMTPREAVPKIVRLYLKVPARHAHIKASPRSYIQQRVYELRRRGYFDVADL